MTPHIWMPLYVTDYLRDTDGLSAAEHGAYLLLLMHAWQQEGLLPAEDGRLRRIAKMEIGEWKRARATVLGFFSRSEDGYRQKRLDHELDHANQMSAAAREQRRTAGLASAEARKRQRESNGPLNGRSNGDGNGGGNGRGNGDANGGQRALATGATPSPSQKNLERSGKKCAGARGASGRTAGAVRSVVKALSAKSQPFTPSRDYQLSALETARGRPQPVEPERTVEEQLAALGARA